jgi:predicted ATPase
VARAMEMSLSGNGPPRQQLLRVLRHRRTLLLLDNLEHLLEGTDLLAEILGSAPEVKLLATSRTRLNLRGEQTLSLSGMDYPELAAAEVVPGQVRRYSSVVLFQRSARRAQPEFELDEKDLPHVAHICRLAQGMPLAILLAAAWLSTLSPAEIAAEMEQGLDILAAEWGDEPARHRSMRATFDVTWALLNDMERQAFVRLSVFRGGFTRQAVQAVAEADLRTLMSLVHKSLVQRGQAGRYEVHELLRQYAEERLDQDPEEKERVLNQHCAYYAELLDREKEQIDRGYGRQEIVPELNNIRAAWQHAVSHRLTANLKSLLCVLGSLHVLSPEERYVALGRAVDALRSGHSGSFSREEASVLGELLRTRAYAAFLCRHEQQVSQLLQESEEILRHHGETVELAWILADRAVLGAVESSAEAEQLLLEALAIWTKAGEQLNVAHAHHALGECAIRRGTYQKAEWHCQEALRINERLDNRFVAGYALMAWGYAVYLQGDYAGARRLYERCLPIELAIGDPTHIPATYYLLGQVALALGEYEEAARRFYQALTGYEDLQVAWTASLSGFCRGSGLSCVRLGDIALAVNNTREAEQRYAQALEVAADEPHPELRLEAVLGQAKLRAQRQDAPSLQERAAELATFVLSHPSSLPETREAAQRLLDVMERTLSSGTFAAAQARGRARDLDATLRELLAELTKEWP